MYNGKPAVLIISGLDPSGGAGLTKDILIVSESGCHPLSLVSSLTLQNSMEFAGSLPVDIRYIKDAVKLLQKEFVLSAVKIGLVPLEKDWLDGLSDILEDISCPIVIDPVLKASTQKKDIEVPENFHRLISGKNRVITPNFKELKAIHSKFSDKPTGSPETISGYIHKKYGCSVVTTFEGEEPFIFIASEGSFFTEKVKLVETDRNIHGTGCAFSSAISAGMAHGKTLVESVRNASDLVASKIEKRCLYNRNGQYFF
jgi:hydroxymethylpyrimidine kinase/phosphomethylpyrimidine kinase